jgi:hypothetical protein
VKRRGLGEILRSRLSGAPWAGEVQAILEEARYAALDNVSTRAILLLYWLRFIGTYLRKCPDRVRDQWWMETNVERVLQTVGGTP